MFNEDKTADRYLRAMAETRVKPKRQDEEPKAVDEATKAALTEFARSVLERRPD